MAYTTLISAEELGQNLNRNDWVIIDCRFDLTDPNAGEDAYAHSHVPGARYAHLEHDLSSTRAPNPDPVPGANPGSDGGRHPMPSPARMSETFGALGIDAGVQVIAYDGGPGSYGARLWWMLRYMGHEAVAVLDGGWASWTALPGPVQTTAPATPTSRVFQGAPRKEWLVTVDQVANPAFRGTRIIDSRDGARFRGELEPLDPVAGHIPGAANRPFMENLDESGRFKKPEVLRPQLETVLAGTPASEAVFYCGSGVTACHNLLALAHAGVGSARLYAGSWSEWCSDPTRPVATGAADESE